MPTSCAKFNDDWYSDAQLVELQKLVKMAPSATGEFVEIGCWEGKSTVAIANACYPATLRAIDTWEGNADESPDHPTVHMAKTRDVFEQFLDNIKLLTKGNVLPIHADCHEYMKGWSIPIKFAHIDACHDYESVRRTLVALLPWVIEDGILCGDDFQSASAQREDLNGGVERAAREMLPGVLSIGNLWWWIKS